MKTLLITGAAAIALATTAHAQDSAEQAADRSVHETNNAQKDAAPKSASMTAADEKDLAAVTAMIATTSDPVVKVGDYTVLSKSAYTADELIGAPVFGADKKQIATIRDIIMDENTAKVNALVVEFGGVLNIGEKTVRAPFDRIKTETKDGQGLVQRRFTLPGTEDDLKLMAAFEKDRLAATEVLATELLDAKAEFVNPDENAEITDPSVSDIVIDRQGAAQYAVVKYNDLMGLGGDRALVPFSRVAIAQGDGGVTLDIAPQTVVTTASFVYTLDDAQKDAAAQKAGGMKSDEAFAKENGDQQER